VADEAIVPTANDGQNRFGKVSAAVGSKSRKRTYLRMSPSFHWTSTDLEATASRILFLLKAALS
jgi:hypothetical protein